MHVEFVEIVGWQLASVERAYPAGHIGGLKPTLRRYPGAPLVGWTSAHRRDRRLAPSVSRPIR